MQHREKYFLISGSAHDQVVRLTDSQDKITPELGVKFINANVNDRKIAGCLQNFYFEGGFKQYIELDKADAATLARLADFVSRSISSQSQALGTGGVPAPITF